MINANNNSQVVNNNNTNTANPVVPNTNIVGQGLNTQQLQQLQQLQQFQKMQQFQQQQQQIQQGMNLSQTSMMMNPLMMAQQQNMIRTGFQAMNPALQAMSNFQQLQQQQQQQMMMVMRPQMMAGLQQQQQQQFIQQPGGSGDSMMRNNNKNPTLTGSTTTATVVAIPPSSGNGSNVVATTTPTAATTTRGTTPDNNMMVLQNMVVVDNKRPINIQNSTVVVPSMNSETVQSILDINKTLLKILLEYQNNGWLDDPEHKIFQTRLHSNLTYLASIADYVLKSGDDTRRPDKLPDLTPVEIPQKLLQLQQSRLNNNSITQNQALMQHQQQQMMVQNNLLLQQQQQLQLQQEQQMLQAQADIQQMQQLTQSPQSDNINVQPKLESKSKSTSGPTSAAVMSPHQSEQKQQTLVASNTTVAPTFNHSSNVTTTVGTVVSSTTPNTITNIVGSTAALAQHPTNNITVFNTVTTPTVIATTSQMLENIKGPPMALDVNQQQTLDATTYTPTPPVVLPPKVGINLPFGQGGVQPPVWVAERTAHANMMKRLDVDQTKESENSSSDVKMSQDEDPSQSFVTASSNEVNDDPPNTSHGVQQVVSRPIKNNVLPHHHHPLEPANANNVAPSPHIPISNPQKTNSNIPTGQHQYVQEEKNVASNSTNPSELNVTSNSTAVGHYEQINSTVPSNIAQMKSPIMNTTNNDNNSSSTPTSQQQSAAQHPYYQHKATFSVKEAHDEGSPDSDGLAIEYDRDDEEEEYEHNRVDIRSNSNLQGQQQQHGQNEMIMNPTQILLNPEQLEDEEDDEDYAPNKEEEDDDDEEELELESELA